MTSVPTRPKIHRLPTAGVKVHAKKQYSVKSMIVGGVLSATLTISLLVYKQPLSISGDRLASVATLPSILVSPQGAPAEEGSIITDATNVLAHPIGDAQASVGVPAQLSPSGSIISLHSNSEYIVGQMTKIPVENEQITEIKAVNEIDKPAGRELLSIISKY